MADSLEKFLANLTDGLSSVLKTSTGIDGEFKSLKTSPADAESLRTSNHSFPLAIQAEFRVGFEGGLLFLFKVEDVTALADIFIGGAGTRSPELSPDMKDAVAEIFNQITGWLKTQCSADFGIPVALGPVTIDTFGASRSSDFSNFLKFRAKSATQVSMKVSTAIDSEFVVVTPNIAFIDEPIEAPTEIVHAAGMPQAAGSAVASHPNLDLLMDVRLPVTVRFGSTTLILRDVLKLGTGSLIELTKTENEPVDLLVNEKLIARGEVVVLENDYAIRILDIESQASRIRSLG